MGLFDMFGGGRKRAAEEERIAEENRQKEHDRQVEEAKAAHEGMGWPVIAPLNRFNVKGVKGGETITPAEDPISGERKEEIGQLIFEPKVTADQVKDFTVPEVIFLWQALGQLNQKAPQHNYEQNARVFYNDILRRIHEAKELYVLYNRRTGYPFLDGGYALVYLDLEHAKKAAQLYALQGREVVVSNRPGEGVEVEEGKERPITLFDYFYYLGIENVLIDNGWYKLPIKRSEISAPPTSMIVNDSDKKNPPAAPALQFALIDFINAATWPVKFEQRDKLMNARMGRINELIPTAKYVVPVQNHQPDAPAQGNGRQEIRLPMVKIKGKNQKTGEERDIPLLPVFTDLFEYAKGFTQQKDYTPVVFDYPHLLGLLTATEGFVINPRGESMVIPKTQAIHLLQENLKKTNPQAYAAAQKRAMEAAQRGAQGGAGVSGAAGTASGAAGMGTSGAAAGEGARVIQFPGNMAAAHQNAASAAEKTAADPSQGKTEETTSPAEPSDADSKAADSENGANTPDEGAAPEDTKE